MPVRLRVDGTTGKVAIYTGTDDLPFDTPLSHVSRLRFHSDLEYPQVISVHTGSFNMPATVAQTSRQHSWRLFEHGLGGTPFVEGYITQSGIRVPLLGTVPVQQGVSNVGSSTTSFATGFARWLHLGADATDVKIQEFSQTMSNENFPALTIYWTVYLTDTVI